MGFRTRPRLHTEPAPSDVDAARRAFVDEPVLREVEVVEPPAQRRWPDGPLSHINVPYRPELRARLERAARADGRSMRSAIQRAVLRWVEQVEAEHGLEPLEPPAEP